MLVKEFHLGGEPKSTSTEIQWKQGMDLTKRVKESAAIQRRKRGFEPKNFFTWFTDHVDPSSDDIAEVSMADITYSFRFKFYNYCPVQVIFCVICRAYEQFIIYNCYVGH